MVTVSNLELERNRLGYDLTICDLALLRDVFGPLCRFVGGLM